MSVVVDASVWVSAADTGDSYSAASRAFLASLARKRTPIVLPANAHLEVACAMARRLRNARAARAIADELLRSPQITTAPLDAAFLTEAVDAGTSTYLRAGDALYVAAARRARGELVSWDAELVDRGGAITPEAWLKRDA